MEIPGKARAVALVLGLGLSPLPVLQPTSAAAQEAREQPVAVSIAPVVLAEPEVETPLEIVVGPEAQLPKQSYVRIRGLPLAAKLSDGHVITPGAWAIPLAALRSLKVMAPISASGRTEITVSVLNVDGAVLAEGKSFLVVAPAWLLGSAANRGKDAVRPQPVLPEQKTAIGAAPALSTAPAAAPTVPGPTAGSAASPAKAAPPPPAAAAAGPPVQSAATPPPAPMAPKPAPPAAIASLPPPAPATAAAPKQLPALRVLTPEEADRAGRLLFQGDNYRGQGNIAAARQFYRRAADMGLALAAMRLAGTYDAAELAQLNVQGIEADAAEARKWYDRARELGSTEAESRIGRLPQPR